MPAIKRTAANNNLPILALLSLYITNITDSNVHISPILEEAIAIIEMALNKQSNNPILLIPDNFY